MRPNLQKQPRARTHGSTRGRLRLHPQASPIQLRQLPTDHITTPHPTHRVEVADYPTLSRKLRMGRIAHMHPATLGSVPVAEPADRWSLRAQAPVRVRLD